MARAEGRPAEFKGSGRPSGSRFEATIAFVDVVGYSAMMARDEARTHVQWMSILHDIVEPEIESNGGELVKSTGDGVLALFPEADQAITWASQVQEAIGGRDDDRAAGDLPIALRISIHCGSVIRERQDVYGDPVNISARLQQYAPPGGIIVSEAVFQQLRLRKDVPVRHLGLLALRNMATPVRAYLLRFGKLELPERAAPSMGTLPSIAVLPFENLTRNRKDAYLADGVVEDIIVSLASLRELVVISRASTLMFVRENLDLQEVGTSLGVQYALAGTFRRARRGIVISAKLVETRHGETLWAERFQSTLEGVFDIQDEIVERVVTGIAPTVRKLEMRRALRKRPETYSAYDYTLRALDIIGALDVDTFARASELLDRAIADDPGFAMAYAWSARWRSILIGQGWSTNVAADAKDAVRLALRAIELDPNNALALATYGHLQSFLYRNYDSALMYLKMAREASPCSALAWILSSATESYLGHGEEAIRMAERALRLSPKGHDLFFFYNFLSIAHYSAGAYDVAVKWGRISETEYPLYTSNLRMLCACLAAVGRIDEAREVADRLLALQPDFRLSSYERERQPFQPPALARQFVEHLRLAGLPE
jgi:adenylate cyclase